MQTIKSFYSVLNVPTNTVSPVSTFHLSFREYLIDVERCKDVWFFVNEEKTHEKLARRCLDLLSETDCLRKDICNLDEPSKLRHDVRQQTIDDKLPPEVQYACRYWARHVAQSKVKLDEKHQAYKFLQQHFLHWLEVLSLIGRLPESISIIQELQTLVDPNSDDAMSKFLQDAYRFILHSYQAIDQTPLQLYSSTLLFARERSIVRQLFQQYVSWVIYKPVIEHDWNPCLQTLDQHNPVPSVSVSSDGKLMASASGPSIKVWDAATRVLRHTLESDGNLVLSVAFSIDSKRVASRSSGKTIQVWDTDTGRLQRTLNDHSGSVGQVAFSNSGLIASGSLDGTIKIWDVSTGELRETLKGHDDFVYSVAFSKDSRLVVSGSQDKTVKVWNATTGELQKVLTAHDGWVMSVAFSSDGNLLASASSDGKVGIWDTVTWVLRHTLQDHNNWVNSVAFSGNSKQLASASNDKTIEIWDMATQELLHVLEGHADNVRSVAFQDSKLLVSGSSDETIKIWDLTQANIQNTLESHSAYINSVAFSSDNRLIASASYDNTVKVWEATEVTVKHTLNSGHAVWSVTFSDDGTLIASGLEDGTVEVWGTLGGKLKHTLGCLDRPVTSAAFSVDNNLIALGSEYGTVEVWILKEGEKEGVLKYSIEDDGPWAQSVAFSADSRLIARLSSDGTVKVWDVAEGRLRQTFDVGNESLDFQKLSFSATASHLFLESEDTIIDLDTNMNGGEVQDEAQIDRKMESITVVLEPNGYILSGEWVLWDRQAIWLPLDYRPWRLDSWAISPSRKMIVIASRSKRLYRIGF